MSPELKISLLSALAAVGSAYWAWSSARSAERSLRIAEEEAASKKENIKCYLINSLRWDEAECNYVSFACTYTNGSNSANTIERVELIVHAFDLSGHGVQILLPPLQKIPKNSEFSSLPVPMNLQPRTTLSGWLTFQLPQSSIQDLIIDKYEVSATTWSGGRISIDSYLVMKERPESED